MQSAFHKALCFISPQTIPIFPKLRALYTHFLISEAKKNDIHNF